MTRTATARQSRPAKATPAHAPRFIPANDNPDEDFDDWEASSASVDLLIRCMTVYAKNEGAWQRPRIQRDLWRAVKAIQPHLISSRR